MAVLLQSICEQAEQKNNYDILVLTQDISEKSKKILSLIIGDKSNFKIRYLNPTPYIQGCSFYIRGHFSIETYFRLVLPELLPDYKKILYLDSDMVVLDDVAKLYNESIDGYLLGACYDADTAGLYNGYEPNKKAYMDQVLQLKHPYQYFQAGTLLINLETVSGNLYGREKASICSIQEISALGSGYLEQTLRGQSPLYRYVLEHDGRLCRNTKRADYNKSAGMVK